MNTLQKTESQGRGSATVIITATWDGVRHWINAAKMFEQGKLFSQVMTGFELLALHKANGISQGKRTDLSTNLPHDAGSWSEIVKKEAGISDDTARRYMDMAKAAAPRLKKLPALKNFDPFTNNIAQLPEPQREALSSAVKKLTDGKSQADFFNELYKQPSGNPNPKDGGDRTPKTTAQQAEAAYNIAMENSGWMGKAVTASNKDFFLTAKESDLEVDAQIDVIEFALKIRKKYRNTPRANREAVVTEILETIAQSDPLRQSDLNK